MKKFWVHYAHNGERAKCQVQSGNAEQAVYNGLGLARRYYPDEYIELIELELISE